MQNTSENIKIDEIIFSSRKTIALIVQRDGKLIVRAPKQATKKQIKEFVDLKSNWIRRKQAEVLQKKAQAVTNHFIEGEKFLYLGSAYPLKVVDQISPPLTLIDGMFLLSGTYQPHGIDIFTNWYKNQARIMISERVKLYATRHKLSYSRINISSARTRWGSCSSTGTLSFTWRLVMAPLPVIDYVVVHELAHIREKNHGKRFWAAVASMLPGYEAQKKWLKQNGHLLTLV
jgi:predicted metal-dependent hydrolase